MRPEAIRNAIREADTRYLPDIIAEAFHTYMSRADNDGIKAVLAAMEEGEGPSSHGAMDKLRAFFCRGGHRPVSAYGVQSSRSVGGGYQLQQKAS